MFYFVESGVYIGHIVVKELHLKEQDQGSYKGLDDRWAWRKEGTTNNEDKLASIGNDNLPEEGIVLKSNKEQPVACDNILVI